MSAIRIPNPPPARPVRVAVVTNGRFHVLDTARELAARGFDVRFYSFVPTGRAMNFGLPQGSSRSLFPIAIPLAAWDRYAGDFARLRREQIMDWVLNRGTRARMEPCDVVIAMSSMANEAALYARAKYGALIYLERGSEHVLVQQQMLQASGDVGPSERVIKRELAGYEFADRISVASPHVADKFGNDRAVRAKLFVNRYGADLDMFPQRETPPDGPPTMVFVGGWVRRKGVDVLLPLLERIRELRLVHCGNASTGSLPQHPRFTSVGSVDQSALGLYYRAADLLIAPSREEGLGLVRVQALASGIPIVCSDNTGAQGLGESSALAERIDAVDIQDIDALESAVRKRLAQRASWTPLPEDDRQLLSWSAYGQRYADRIKADLAARMSGLPLPALR